MVDAILESGMPAPIDVQVNTRDLNVTYDTAQDLARRIRALPGVGEIYIPQDMNYPAIRLDVDRVHAGELGLTQKDMVDNVITALNSNTMIAPNYWVDYKTGNDYFLSVQYAEHGPGAIHNMVDLKQIPLRAPKPNEPTTLDSVVKLENLTITHRNRSLPDPAHRRYLRDAGGRGSRQAPHAIARRSTTRTCPANIRVNLRGMVQGMDPSFKSFAYGFGISFVLLLLILIAQFRSFIDPFLIMLAIPMGFVGVLIILPLTHTTFNVMSLMGVLMLIGIADSNSILIVDFAHKLEDQGLSVARRHGHRVPRAAAAHSDDLARHHHRHASDGMKLGEGGEQYTPMARAIIGGLTSSVLLTVFIVPAAYLLVYRRIRIEMFRTIIAFPASRHLPRQFSRPQRIAQTPAETDSAGSRSAGDSESSAGAGRAVRSELSPTSRSSRIVPPIIPIDRRYHGFAGQRSGADRRRRYFGIPPIQPLRPGRGGAPIDYGFRPHSESGQQLALAGASDGANRAGHALRRAAAGELAPTSTCCTRKPW